MAVKGSGAPIPARPAQPSRTVAARPAVELGNGMIGRYDVNLSTGVVQGTLGRTPAERARSAGVVSKVAGAVSSSDPGGFKASGITTPLPYLAKPASTPGRTVGAEPLAPPSSGGVRPSSVARGSTAGGAARAVVTAGKGAQKVSKVTAKTGGRGAKGRTVRF